jgi:hypothetical protein
LSVSKSIIIQCDIVTSGEISTEKVKFLRGRLGGISPSQWRQNP